MATPEQQSWTLTELADREERRADLATDSHEIHRLRGKAAAYRDAANRCWVLDDLLMEYAEGMRDALVAVEGREGADDAG